jgi:predicted nucleotidyltransferase
MNKKLREFKKILRSEMPNLISKYEVETLELFGSYVKDKQKTESDLDILVTFKRTPGLFKYIQLENYLSDVLGVKVDLVMRSSLKTNIGRIILSEAVPL